ncbi:LysR-family transcriptional regulator [Streptomyces hygroscopicus subsp. limoneus]|nr:LysR-family transcriptional regulator [Streptomyces hygroscopicus subsp. limoneus]
MSQHIGTGGYVIGRETEFGQLTALVDAAREGHGASALVHGEAGIGKSRLASAVVEAASSAGFAVLSCHGIRDAGAAGFEGLHELLLPLLDRIDALPPRQRMALKVAFGAEGEPADRFITGLAAFGLLEEAAARGPLVLLVEDLHWLDRSTADVVAFLAARMSVMPALLLATSRTDRVYPDRKLHFKHHVYVTPLGHEDALKLVALHAPALTLPQRRRLVERALGNPLALTEWSANPSWVEGPPSAHAGRVPMGRRLEDSFLAEVALLPPATQQALLVAAAAEDASSYEVLAAARNLGLEQGDFAPAERFGLLTLTRGTYKFRHPLVGSAVYDNADFGARARVHTELAAVVVDAARAVQHRAAAVAGWDEDVAAELEALAVTAGRRGARSEAAAAWRRAATLTPVAADRARRTVMAAEMARQAGSTADAVALLTEARPIVEDEASTVQFARTEWMLAGSSSTLLGRGGDELVAMSRRLSDPADRIEVLTWAAVRSYLRQDTSLDLAAAVADELRRADAATEPQQVLRGIGLALVSPADRIGSVEKALSFMQREAREAYATLLNCLAFAVEDTHDLPLADRVWGAGVDMFHQAARAGDVAVALSGRSTVRVTANTIAAGLTDAELALRLSYDLDLPVVGALAAANIARARAWRGEHEPATAALNTCAELSGPTPVPRVAAVASWASAQVAANEGRADEAVAHLLACVEHPPIGVWAGGDIADTAVRAGRPELVGGWLDMATAALASGDSGHLAMLVERSRALLARGSEARGHFERAIERGEGTTAFLDLAKTRLFFGEWLRRERRIVEARSHLSAALHVFESHHAAPLVRRTARELGAAGSDVQRPQPGPALDAGTVLTAQELHVARLAAQGYTNRQIADQLYLSHRTVGAHLYKVYAKLQINRRSQLAAALASDTLD